MADPSARRIKVNFAWLILERISSRLAQIVGYLLLARHLGGAGFGQLMLPISYLLTFFVLSDWGLSTLLTRDVASGEVTAKCFVRQIVPIKVGLIVFATCGALGLARVLKIPLGEPGLVAASAVYFALLSLSGFLYAYWAGREQMKWQALALSGQNWSFCLLVIGLVLWKADVNLFAWGLAGSACVPVVILLPVTLRGVSGWRGTGLGKAQHYSIWLRGTWIGLGALASDIAMRSGSTILGVYRNAQEVGWLNFATRIYESMLMIPSTYRVVVYPVMARLGAGEETRASTELARKGVRDLLALTLPCAVGIFVFGDRIVRSLVGDSFASSVEAVKILALVIPVSALNDLLIHLHYAQGRVRIAIVALVAGMACCLGYSLIRVSSGGYLAVSRAILVGQVVLFTVALTGLSGAQARSIFSPGLLKILAATGATFVISLGTVRLPWAAGLGIIGVAYLALIVFLRVYPPSVLVGWLDLLRRSQEGGR